MIPMIQVLPDFNRARYAEWCYSDHLGTYVGLLNREELVEGRWEPFCSEIARDAFTTGRATEWKRSLPAVAAAWTELIR